MNLKTARKLRRWVKTMMSQNNAPIENETMYTMIGEEKKQRIVQHNTFRGMYRIAKKELKRKKVA